jgi:hypothetical protein
MNCALLFGMFSAPQNLVLVPKLKSALKRLMCGAKVEWLRLVSIGKSDLNWRHHRQVDRMQANGCFTSRTRTGRHLDVMSLRSLIFPLLCF